MLKKHSTVIAAILIFLIGLAADLAIIHLRIQNYWMQMELICTMADEESDLSIATGILKGKVDPTDTAQKGKEKLIDYGFFQGENDIFTKQLRTGIIRTQILFLLAYAIVLVLLGKLHTIHNRQLEQELERLSDCLDQLSKKLYEMESLPSFHAKNQQLRKIYEQLQSISDVMRLNHTQLIQEKEETKSLVTDISHQLKTPVAALRTCFDILNQKNLTPEEHEEFLQRCYHQMDGLEELMKSLLSISRLEAGMIEIRLAPGVLFDTIAMAVSRIYPFADSKKILIEMEAEEELQQLVLPHDRNWMAEALINLLENAVKYSPTESRIQIRMQKRVSFLRIEIEDQGIGIPKAEYHKVFQRFYRGVSKEVQSQKGSGVGLYLTREIIRRHQGNISVSSRWDVGQKKSSGTVFVIQLPFLTEM